VIIFLSKCAGGLLVREVPGDRRAAGDRVLVRPGEAFHGRSYAELASLGNGCHELGGRVAGADELAGPEPAPLRRPGRGR
jgi:hypothetical protein